MKVFESIDSDAPVIENHHLIEPGTHLYQEPALIFTREFFELSTHVYRFVRRLRHKQDRKLFGTTHTMIFDYSIGNLLPLLDTNPTLQRMIRAVVELNGEACFQG